MQYIATIKKPSAIHTLWRGQHLHKVDFQDTLFTYDVRTDQYVAKGELPNLGRLMRHPHVHIVVVTEPVGEVVSAPEVKPEPQTTASETAVKVTEEPTEPNPETLGQKLRSIFHA